MKALKRNKSTFYYSLYEGKSERTDEYGNRTGEYDILRGKPLKYEANISAATGETSTRQFGGSENYDKVIVADNELPPIDEYTVLWVDNMPTLNEDGSLAADSKPYDYVVKKIAKSLNSFSIAINKVNVK